MVVKNSTEKMSKVPVLISNRSTIAYKAKVHCVSKKHVTTFSTITLTISVQLQ